MNIVQRVCLIVADAVIVVVTIYHTYGTMKISREANIQATFSRTLLRAGQSKVPSRDVCISTLMIGYTRHTLLRVRAIVVLW